MSAVFNYDEKFSDLHPDLNTQWYHRALAAENHRKQCKDVSFINSDLAKTRRALVVMGCSFADGQGSIHSDYLSELTPRYHKINNTYDYTSPDFEVNDIANLAVKHDLPVLWNHESEGKIKCMTYHSELYNSWGSQLGRHLDNQYTIINLADRGSGNNSSIQKTVRYPIRWDLCDEVLVIWSVCDYTRWSMLHSQDFKRDYLTSDSRTFWWLNTEPKSGASLDYLMSKEIYSPMFFIDQYIDNCTQITLFLKQFSKSNIVLMPAFSPLPENDPNMEWHYYLTLVAEKSGNELAKIIKNKLLTDYAYTIDNHTSIADYLLSISDSDITDWHDFVGTYGGKRVSDWISPCSHPSYKSQTQIAQRLHEHITENVL